MVAEAGQPTIFADAPQLGTGMALARSTIDLYLSMAHEEANPVPVDELVRGPGRVERPSVRAGRRRRRDHALQRGVIMAFQKLIPALMAGNSVILRPSPLTPISSLVFGAAADAAGLPPGVLSVVVEEGAAGAELLTTAPRRRHGVVHRLDRGRDGRSWPRPRRR